MPHLFDLLLEAELGVKVRRVACATDLLHNAAGALTAQADNIVLADCLRGFQVPLPGPVTL